MRHLNGFTCAIALVLFVTAVGPAACTRTREAQRAAVAEAQIALAALVDSKHVPDFARGDDRGVHVWREVRRFYKQHGYAPVWSDGRAPRPQMDALIAALHGADQEGLDPADYGAEVVAQARQAFDQAHAADIDVRCTYAYLQYAFDLAHGTVDPEDLDSHWHAAPRDVDLHAALEQAIENNRVAASLQELAPKAPQYAGLKRQLSVNRGDAALARLIALNMDRWRWLPDDLGERYIIVNIPAFRLDAIEHGRSVLEMKVVTGRKDNPTPVLADRLKAVVFSPYWNIPKDIAEKEILPKAALDPLYLERNNIEVDEDGRYRQRPGRGNSLGLVKFVFPNHFNVYLHDTPAQQLFGRVERDFSHGCVRLEQPVELAKYVLRDRPDWTEQRITAAMHDGIEQSVPLKEPLPIYLVYFTAWEEDGALETRPDVYGHDRRHMRAVDR